MLQVKQRKSDMALSTTRGTYLVNFAANLWQVSLEPSGASNLTIQGGWEERLFQERAHFSCEEEGVFSKTTYCLTA